MRYKIRGHHKEKVDSRGKTSHPERDQFIEGKIGSAYMSTIAGQPDLDKYTREIAPGHDFNSKSERKSKRSPKLLEDQEDF